MARGMFDPVRYLELVIQESLAGMESRIMAAIDDLNTADTNLSAKVASILQDFATAVQNAGTDPAALEKVANDMNTMASNIVTADPNAAGTPSQPTPAPVANPANVTQR